MAFRAPPAVVVAAILATSGGTGAQSKPLRPPPWAEFGTSVAALPGVVFVADSPKSSEAGRGPGAIHVFERRVSSWVASGVLAAPDMTVEDTFGVSMAADGNTLVVGAHFADGRGTDSGLAYVFERRNAEWRQTAVVSASDATAGDHFGFLVSISGDTIVVGARLADTRGDDAGAAYVFERRQSTWRQVAKLTASDAAAGDLFGRARINGNTIMVSADLNDDRGNAAGKAYVFEKRGDVWSETGRLFASDAAERSEFGVSLSFTGGMAVFGAIGAAAPGTGPAGAAYVFERRHGTWTETARLAASDGGAGHWFGLGVAASGDIVVIGAPGHDGGGKAAGAAYVFERRADMWTQRARLVASDTSSQRGFGSSVAITGDTIVVGALTDGGGTHRGAAYVFERRTGSWAEVARLVRP